ncbi:hypothetical protein BpHYR1_033821 [Brachionus plicatilis]|uniref:Uncharacterized protein n=1 Tax=Brachionus plicatilis TaxID=10195 RepID=A0A3M7RDB5_BRAPC|nr:hypothetical protein BpHYR1_033821 [Brachionus plicatilis]
MGLNFGIIVYNFRCNRVNRFNPFEPHIINRGGKWTSSIFLLTILIEESVNEFRKKNDKRL